MKTVLKSILVLVMVLSTFIGTFATPAKADTPLPVSVSVMVQTATGLTAPSSFPVTTVGGGTILDNIYNGWCADLDNEISLNSLYNIAYVYSSLLPLPAGLVNLPGNVGQVNWILNQGYVGRDDGLGTYNFMDVQAAIWQLLEGNNGSSNFGPSWSLARTNAILAAAGMHGGYIPPPGSLMAIFLDVRLNTNIDTKAQTLLIPREVSSNGGNGEDPAALGNFVWNDVDHDGIQDAGEPGIAGVTVELYNSSNVLVGAPTTTSASGIYGFAFLVPGDYYVKFVLPAGYDFTLPNVGSDATDSDADGTGITATTTLTPGETDLTWDAGLYVPRYVNAARTIGYWKNHQTLLASLLTQGPINLGDTNVTTLTGALAVFKNANSKDARIMLKAQLLGAILNLRNGANPLSTGSDIRPVIAAAQTFLATHTTALTGGSADRTEALRLKDLLDRYNNSGE